MLPHSHWRCAGGSSHHELTVWESFLWFTDLEEQWPRYSATCWSDMGLLFYSLLSASSSCFGFKCFQCRKISNSIISARCIWTVCVYVAPSKLLIGLNVKSNTSTSFPAQKKKETQNKIASLSLIISLTYTNMMFVQLTVSIQFARQRELRQQFHVTRRERLQSRRANRGSEIPSQRPLHVSAGNSVCVCTSNL